MSKLICKMPITFLCIKVLFTVICVTCNFLNDLKLIRNK